MIIENGDRIRIRVLDFFIPSFHAGFNELLFVSIALTLAEAFVNFDQRELLIFFQYNT